MHRLISCPVYWRRRQDLMTFTRQLWDDEGVAGVDNGVGVFPPKRTAWELSERDRTWLVVNFMRLQSDMKWRTTADRVALLWLCASLKWAKNVVRSRLYPSVRDTTLYDPHLCLTLAYHSIQISTEKKWQRWIHLTHCLNNCYTTRHNEVLSLSIRHYCPLWWPTSVKLCSKPIHQWYC